MQVGCFVDVKVYCKIFVFLLCEEMCFVCISVHIYYYIIVRCKNCRPVYCYALLENDCLKKEKRLPIEVQNYACYNQS